MASAITRPHCNSFDQISNSQHHQVAGKKGVNGDRPRALTKQRWVGARKTGLGGEVGHQTRASQPHSELPESRWRSEQTLVLLSETEPFAQRLGGLSGTWDTKRGQTRGQSRQVPCRCSEQHQVIVSLAAGLVVCVLAESWALPLHWSHVKYSWWGRSAAGGPYPVSIQDDSEAWGQAELCSRCESPPVPRALGSTSAGLPGLLVTWRTWGHHEADVVETIPSVLAVKEWRAGRTLLRVCLQPSYRVVVLYLQRHLGGDQKCRVRLHAGVPRQKL